MLVSLLRIPFRVAYSEGSNSPLKFVCKGTSVTNFSNGCYPPNYGPTMRNEDIRNVLLAHMDIETLKTMRLACRDFSERAATLLFSSVTLTFSASSLSRPSRIPALARIGYLVKHLKFSMSHSDATSLPPLEDPVTGEKIAFYYAPLTMPPTTHRPKYGT